MANLFLLNLVAYGDRVGLGAYETGHFLQHLQYLNALAAKGITMPDYDILRLGPGPEAEPDRFLGDNANHLLSWLNDHEAIHEILRQQANASGTNLSQLDPDSAESWELWQEAHRIQHAQLDAHFGTT
jgi:hypothetical protein